MRGLPGSAPRSFQLRKQDFPACFRHRPKSPAPCPDFMFDRTRKSCRSPAWVLAERCVPRIDIHPPAGTTGGLERYRSSYDKPNPPSGGSDRETEMSGHLLITSAIMLAIAGPAFADCNQEIQSLNEAVTQAETGASTDAALPATPHQEEVIAGGQQGDEAAGDTGQAEACIAPSAGGDRRYPDWRGGAGACGSHRRGARHGQGRRRDRLHGEGRSGEGAVGHRLSRPPGLYEGDRGSGIRCYRAGRSPSAVHKRSGR